MPAINLSISDGIHINVTLLFGVERNEAVVDAYLSGLEERVEKGESVDQIASVASFFLSRIDVLVDPMLHEKRLDDLKGETASALARKEYEI